MTVLFKVYLYHAGLNHLDGPYDFDSRDKAADFLWKKYLEGREKRTTKQSKSLFSEVFFNESKIYEQGLEVFYE